MVVKDTQRGNTWAKAAWPMYAMLEDYSTELLKIKVPVLVVVGRQDKVETTDRLRIEVLEKIQGARLVVVEDSGHLLPLEQPTTLVREIKAFCENF